LDDPGQLQAKRENVRRLARPHAALEIVTELLKLKSGSTRQEL